MKKVITVMLEGDKETLGRMEYIISKGIERQIDTFRAAIHEAPSTSGSNSTIEAWKANIETLDKAVIVAGRTTKR
jgi:hypothetical protein